jgi:OmpA-OmpF porin, OOP family
MTPENCSISMRKLLIICVICLPGSSVFSQLKLGIHAGPAASSIIETNDITNWDSAYKPFFQKRNSIQVGVFATLPINNKKNLVFQTGINYQAMGNKFLRSYDTLNVRRKVDTVFVDSKFSTNYISIPVNLAYSLKLGKKSSFNLSAGPYISLYLNGSTVYSLRTFKRDSVKNTNTDTVDRKSIQFKTTETPFEVGKGSPKIKMMDVGYNVRVFFDLGGVFITGFYSESFSNFYKASYSATFRHRYMGGSFGIWLNKKNKTQKP